MLEHGGNLRDAAQRFGRAREDWLDLSTGLNPQAYPVPELARDIWQLLPEPNPDLVLAATSCYHAPMILPVAGTQAAIQALPRLRPPSRVVVAAPSYAEHAHHWAQHGHTLQQLRYTELDDAVDQCEVLVVCNPNNPTGATIAPERLLGWAGKLAERGGWLVVDEAFCDVTPSLSVAPWSGQPGLIVLRSVGKFFGLAGLRLGFVAAHAELLKDLSNLLGPWCVSTAAQEIGLAALADTEWQMATRKRLSMSGLRLHQLLAEHGIDATGSALFQWWEEKHPELFWQFMAERGIWVRLFAKAARGIRLGLPPDEAGWTRLTDALEEWDKENKR